MCATKRVEDDIKRNESDTSMSTSISNMNVAQEAYQILHGFVANEYRGRHDTWTAARERVAVRIGLSVSYSKRLWQRWETMDDVSGEALRVLYRAEQARERHAERRQKATTAFAMARSSH